MSQSQDKFLSLLEIWIKLVGKLIALPTSEHSPRLHLEIRQEDHWHFLASRCAEGLGLDYFCLFRISQWGKTAAGATFAKPASPQALEPCLAVEGLDGKMMKRNRDARAVVHTASPRGQCSTPGQ